jgi:hypothetical protein
MRWKRPETHQNLIHIDKDHALGATPGDRRLHLETPVASQFQTETTDANCFRFSAIHNPIISITVVVEVIGLEPTTPCLQSRCSPS